MHSVVRFPRPDSLFAVRAGELLADGKSKQALELCRRGLIYYPENPSGYTMLANAFLAMGERERAHLVLVDGYRRTRSEPLRRLSEQLGAVPPTIDLQGPTPLPTVISDERADSADSESFETAAQDVIATHADDAPEAERGKTGSGKDDGDSEQENADSETAPAVTEERPASKLALHVLRTNPGTRSSNLRLIPGLEFAPLRHEDSTPRQSLASLMHEPLSESDLPFPLTSSGTPTPPPLPSGLGGEPATEKDDFRLPAGDALSKAITELTGKQPAIPRNPGRIHELVRNGEGGELTPLEELARRLETARIPVVDEGDAQKVFEPSIVSDTLAEILVQQNAYAEAMKAFQTLARLKPERLDYYQEKIEEMKFLMTTVGSGGSKSEREGEGE